MFRLGLVDTLVTHANIKGIALTPLSGDRRGYTPPLLKTKTKARILGVDSFDYCLAIQDSIFFTAIVWSYIIIFLLLFFVFSTNTAPRDIADN